MVRPARLGLLVLFALRSTAHADDPFDLFDMREEEEEPEDEVVSCDGDEPAWPCVIRADGEPAAAPAEVRESIDRRDLWELGAGDVGHPAAAARALGVWLESDGGIALAGATSLEHRWTVEGFPIDALNNGGAETRIPIAFLETIEVITGGVPASARASTGAIIDARLRGPREEGDVAVRVWTGASAPARPLRPVPDVFDPLTLELDDPVAIGAVATGGGPVEVGRFDREWIFLGGSMSLHDDGAERVSHRLRDVDGDGLYDRADDGTLVTDVIDRQRRGGLVAPNLAMLLRLGGGEGVHDLAATVLAGFSLGSRMSGDGTAAATTAIRTQLTGDAFATWTSRWPRTELTVTAGWHRAARRESASEAGAGDQRLIGTPFIPRASDVPEDATYAVACTDSADPAEDPFPTVLNCPVPTGYYLRGGIGQLVDLVSDRPAVTAELARRFRAAGRHRAAAGVTGEDARWVVDRRWSGGAIERRLSVDAILTYRLVELEGPDLDDDCGDVACNWLGVATETYRTRYLAAWLEDSWQPARGLTVQAGLRWESMEVGDAVRFTDQLAPRVGVALDPTGRGLGRVFAAWSRLHPALPAGLGIHVADEPALYTRLDLPTGPTHVIDPNQGVAIADDLRAPVVDELVAGAEWVVAERLQVGALIRQRSLRHGMEVVAGTLDNPGDVAGGPLPVRRDSRDLQVWFGNAPDARVHVRVGWVRSRQRGSWPGPFDPIEGVTLYESSFEGAAGNDHGKLPLDLPHRLIAESVIAGSRAGYDLTLGLRFEIASGRPVGALAGPDGEVRLLPRGSAGRMPTTSTAMLHVAARRGRFELALDVVDVFDRRAPAAVDERWTTAEDVLPIEGGSEADLIWARDLDGRRVAPNPGYGMATRYRAPLAGRLSLSATF